MDNTNGTPRTTQASRATNGINGAIKSPINGRAPGNKMRTKSRRSGMFARIFSIAARLLTWYSILSIIFRCPASLDACDDTSPRICKPYFQLKHAVSPHIEPYYDAYASPYIDVVRPYYNTLDQKIIAPSWAYAKQHGAPRLQQAQALGKAQWEKSVQPQVEKYQSLVRAQYDEKLAPYVKSIATALGPYYEIVRTNSLQTYHEFLVPTYLYVQPHLVEAYRATSAFTSNTVVPAFVWTWNRTYTFLDGTVGPQIRTIYVENVEPQLVKIGKRLGRYSTGKKSVPKPPIDSSTSILAKTTSSFTKPAASVTATPTPTYASSSTTATAKKERHAAESARSRSTLEPIPPPEVDEKLEKEDPRRRETREIVAADLKDWQERYAKAADEAAAEIDDRVQEIAQDMMQRNAGVKGKAHLERLQTAAITELVNLRRAIIEIIGTVNKGRVTHEDAQEQIVRAVRQAGMSVKSKAQAVRTWRESFEQELQRSVTQAAETHFSILENIRDLALQKIGMKWAWTDGITYKDWAKYHQLKGRFDEWKSDLQSHVVSHPSLELAQIEAANIEDEAMEVAASTARELARLKQVANWKLIAGDDTPEFDSTLMQQAAEAAEAAKLAAASAADSVGDAAKAAKDSVLEGISDGVSLASEAASQASGAVLGSQEVEKKPEEPEASSESTSTASETSDPSSEPAVEAYLALEDNETSHTEAPGDENAPESNAETTSENIAEPDVKTEAETVASFSEESFASEQSQQSETVSKEDSIVSEEPPSVVEPTSEPTADAADQAQIVEQPEVASSLIFETPVILGNVTEQVEVVEEEKANPVELPIEHNETVEDGQGSGEVDTEEDGLPISETATVKSALFGAAAQSVPSRKPILDEDTLDDVSATMESMREDLKSAYTSAMSRASDQYSQALSIVSAQIHGTPEPAHQKLLASVTAAYSSAMASASSRLDDAIKGASGQLYGSTTTKTGVLPTTLPVPAVEWSQIESIASQRLLQGRQWAEEQYESAKIAIGLATPTPSTPAEHVSKMLDNARHNYYANLGLAHARYSEFMAAASSALRSMTATPTPTDVAGSASSVASVASESAVSAASAVSDGASSALSAAADGVSSAASVASENVSAAGDKVAEGWDAVVTKISLQVYGAPTPTPWYASVYNTAGEYASSATSAAGAAGAYAAAGSEELAKQYSAVSSIMSEVLIGKEPSFSESVISRLGAAYATGVASASSVGDKVASAAAEATAAVKDTASSIRDEL
ncbi:hypothetical protein C7999DRAFT_32684 [Corynascus novoguineensis]|uniref:Uncharacterized protein n=1 Tax=Corynascus novoguineensis TaxID=1126955 RepID=A0AAN7CRC9_9PEZI|nr:hypothetical protein C7999DRAFT_32684 [Corynascus novoguineensis]